MITRSQIRRLSIWAVVTILGGLIGYAYLGIFHPEVLELGLDGDPQMKAARVGMKIAAFVGAFEIFVMRMRFGRWLRSLPLYFGFPLRVLILTVGIVIVMRTHLLAMIWNGVLESKPEDTSFLFFDVLAALGISSLVIAALQVRHLVGAKTFQSLLLGGYRKPREEARIFAIFDIVGSTKIAEKLGNLDFHAFVSSTFFDIDSVIVDKCGEVHQFVGDAVIATWPLGKPERNASSINAAFAVLERLAETAEVYHRQFGIAPNMRVVLHAGEVVAGETGDSRRQITYLGDVLNVTSRIEGVAKAKGVDVAVSAYLLEHTDLPETIAAYSLGNFDLKGVDQPVEIFEIRCAIQNQAIPMAAQ